jgi:hypothetical protein
MPSILIILNYLIITKVYGLRVLALLIPALILIPLQMKLPVFIPIFQLTHRKILVLFGILILIKLNELQHLLILILNCVLVPFKPTVFYEEFLQMREKLHSPDLLGKFHLMFEV